MSRVPTKGIDYTSKDYESFRNDMIKNLQIRMPEYTDTRQSDAGIVILELLAQGLDIISYYQDVLANEAFLSTAEQRSSILKWCQMLGYIPKASTPSEFTQVFVLSSAQSTDTVIPIGTKVKTRSSSTEPEIYFETASDLVIPAGSLGNEKLGDDYRYSVKVIQGVSVSGELLGSSTGSKDQSFKLNYTPVILDSISVSVNEGDGFERWERVDSFIDSTSTSRVYTATINDNDEAVITFGDGVFGKIPLAYDSGIYCDYRVGGGTQGNVGAEKICLLDSNIALVESTFNPNTADVEGHNKESIEEIKMNAPASYRTIWGAITTQDFAEVTKANFPEVDKVVAYRTGEKNTDINLYVMLKDDAPLKNSLKQSILDMFDENKGGRKLIGAGQVYLFDALTQYMGLDVVLKAKPRYDSNVVSKQVEDFIRDYFATYQKNFNTTFYPSDLSAKLLSESGIEGIEYIIVKLPSGGYSLTPKEGHILVCNMLSIGIIEDILEV